MKRTPALLCTLVLIPFIFGNAGCTKNNQSKRDLENTFVIGAGAFPKSLLFYLEFGSTSSDIDALVLETLLEEDPKDRTLRPRLAKSWTISKDKKTFNFTLDERAKFSDGSPVTAEDVKFTFATIMDSKNKTVPFQSYLSNLSEVNIISKNEVQFVTSTIHFENLTKLGGLQILQKSFYGKGDFNKDYNWVLQGSGPYTLSKVNKGDRVELIRNSKYWGWELPQNKDRYTFDKVIFKSHEDTNVLLEMLKRGDIDYLRVNISKMWATQMDGPNFQNGYIKKLEIYNKAPRATQFFVWNMRLPLFQDVRVRKALAHLMDRERWIRELFFNQYEVSASVFANNSDYHDSANKPVPFAPTEAKKLLEQAGWKKVNTDGIRTQSGKALEFTVLVTGNAGERFLTMYQEDLKKMGVKMNIQYTDWATSLKLMSEFKFDARMMARGRGLDPSDIHVTWGSKAAKTPGSANYPGFSNPKVDAMAPMIDQNFDRGARIKLCHQIEKLIHQAHPVAHSWEPKFSRVAYRNRFSFPGKGYQNYDSDANLWETWKFDKKKAEKLVEAIAKGKTLN